MRAVFLDRDGTINKEVDNLRRARDLRVLPGVSKAIQEMNRLGFLVVIITNQPVIARGWVTHDELAGIHKTLLARLKKGGAHIDAIYYCPHHPNANLKEYKVICECRKPMPGLIVRAMKDLDITPRGSFMVGDKTVDILAGKRAKVKTILVETGYAGKDGTHDVSPDFAAKNLKDAVKIIKRHGK